MQMRRVDRAMSQEWAWSLLAKGEYGILATIGEDHIPYAIPLSYIVDEQKIYFHSALEGRKITNITFCQDVCFTVVGRTHPVYDHNFTTYFESVIITGTMFTVEDPKEKTRILYKLAEKYLPGFLDYAEPAIKKSLARTGVLGIKVREITGKAKLPKSEQAWN